MYSILFYNKTFAVTFDETFAKATGARTGIYNMIIAFLAAIMALTSLAVPQDRGSEYVFQ